MKLEANTLIVTPPRMIATLVRGFNTTAGNIHLILLPLLLDLSLWLGPKLRVRELFMPVVNSFTANMLKISPPELIETVKSSQTIWEQLLSQFNVFTALRTIPVGVPSLIGRQSPMVSPLSIQLIYESTSIQAAVAVLGALLLVGFLLGTFYFNMISRVTAEKIEKLNWKVFFNQFVNIMVLFLMLVAGAIIIAVPVFILLSIFSLISPGLGQFFILVVGFVILWLVMPLVFSPHGIFTHCLKAYPSVLLSVRLIRFFLPGTGLFIMTSVLISEGLNMLWMLPDASSWLTLVGIGGHAFIVTALITASFLFYRDGLRWMQFNLQKIAASAEKVQENGGTPVEQ